MVIALPTPSRSPSPSPSDTPTATPSDPALALRGQRILDRFAERRHGTDRRMVILVLFTGVISVTAIAMLSRRARRR
ncbi:hypothetical protein [Streptosporangium carneum]|uniref:Uncharacterized protein n=1 Tax=Streptosporangium carneum TaxID=47481 RepID=A0A9W6HV18_9ACTN|nr:hypothetical protein [Streptosporangium carneum]GLK06856.1 hypothetical protein GCM10017600_02610 [Streptosporangium carneum]